MTVVELVRTRLLSVSAVTALVGTRIYALKFRQGGGLPAIRLTAIGGSDPLHLRGSVGLLTERVQVDCAADEQVSGSDPYAAAHAVMAAVQGTFVAGAATGLSGFSGIVAGVRVAAIMPTATPRESFAPDELRQVVVSRDYLVSYYG